ncbi:uncharacterized protein LOC120353352 [Nilaparvata lugens]|uniref:uncharacterized protein LOC120353352 n=1 Tax=Nilaparvata lugens TaxID=108931 RepID=UPI00193C91A0|nr:uncharacterized protein LOC120353352 [Nilaparvata lugens]
MWIFNLHFILASICVIKVSFCFDLLGIDTGQKGPLAWDIQFKRIENCKERGPKLMDFDLRLKRVSRTRVDMVGNITFKVDYGDNIKGPLAWDIQFKRIENCKERGPKLMDFDLRLKRVSRTRVDMVGNITFKVDYGDNIKIISDFSTWGNGGWKSNAYRFTIKKACTEFSVFENFIVAIRKESGMPLTTCPIPKGTYELENFDTRVINNISIPFYTIPTLWRMTFSHYDKSDNRLLDCKVFIVESKVKHLKRQHDQDHKKVEKT